MEKKNNTTWSAGSILEEINSCAKHLTIIYNTASMEATNDRIRKDFLNILMEEHQLLKDIYSLMQRRGLFAPQAADSHEISQAQQRYSQHHR